MKHRLYIKINIKSLRVRITLQYQNGGLEGERNIVYSWFISSLWVDFLPSGTLHAKHVFPFFYYLQLALYIKVLADVWLMVSIYHPLQNRRVCSQLRPCCVRCFKEALHLFMKIHQKSVTCFQCERHFDSVSFLALGEWESVEQREWVSQCNIQCTTLKYGLSYLKCKIISGSLWLCSDLLLLRRKFYRFGCIQDTSGAHRDPFRPSFWQCQQKQWRTAHSTDIFCDSAILTWKYFTISLLLNCQSVDNAMVHSTSPCPALLLSQTHTTITHTCLYAYEAEERCYFK